MEVRSIFNEIRAEITLLFGKHLPNGWEDITVDLINALEKAKGYLSNPFAATIAALFPNGIGMIVLDDLLKVINETLPGLEIAQGAEAAGAGITDPVAKANAILAYILSNISKLPADWQGKHWLDIAKTILVAALGITATEANALINTKLGQIKAA